MIVLAIDITIWIRNYVFFYIVMIILLLAYYSQCSIRNLCYIYKPLIVISILLSHTYTRNVPTRGAESNLPDLLNEYYTTEIMNMIGVYPFVTIEGE